MAALNRHAFVGGVLGAAGMTAASRAGRTGVMAELEQLTGTLAAAPHSTASRVIGVTTQLINGGLLAQLYAIAFDYTGLRAGWRTGLGLGVMHGAAAGLFLSVVQAAHPRVPEQLPDPGPFMLNRGARSAAAFIGLHAVFGTIVGAVYARSEPGP